MIQLNDGFNGSRMIVIPANVREYLSSDAFSSVLYVTDIGYYPHAQYHFRSRPQGGDEYILIYCTDGKGWINLAGVKHPITSGTFFIIPPHIKHSYGADEFDPWSIYWIHFLGSAAPYFGDGYDHVSELSVTEESRISSRIELFEELYSTLEKGYSQHGLQYASSVLSHLLASFKYITEFQNSNKTLDDAGDIISRCRHYMLERIEQKITLTELCQYMGYSPSYCTDLFNRYTGMSPVQYLQDLRIQAAIKMFETSNMNVSQVSHKVGVSDPYYFSRMFSKKMGVSPSEYRKMKIKSMPPQDIEKMDSGLNPR